MDLRISVSCTLAASADSYRRNTMKDLHGIDLDLLFDNESEYGEEYRQEELRDEDIYHGRRHD